MKSATNKQSSIARNSLEMIQYKGVFLHGHTFSRRHYLYYHPAGMAMVDLNENPDKTWQAYYVHVRAGRKFQAWLTYQTEPSNKRLAVRAGKFINECITKARKS